MMLIDFQLAHHSSPVTDLTFLIFSSTCRKFRDDQYPRLVEIYYKSLETHLKLFGFSMDHCYPRRTIEKHFVEYLPYCLTTLFTVTRVMCATCFGQDQLNKLYKSSGRGSLFDCYTEEAEKEYAIRINEIVEDFVKYGYLKI